MFGELCVLKGKLENKNGTLEIRTGRIFKIIFMIIILLTMFGLIAVIIQNELTVIFDLVTNVFVMRFIFLELGFRHISKKAITKLTEIIGIKELKKHVTTKV